MITCVDARQLIAEAWQGELDSSAKRDLDRHLECCDECSAEAAGLTGLWERLAALPAPEPSFALHARWQATLAGLHAQAPRASRTRFPAWLSAGAFAWQAAVALACLIIGFLAGSMPRQNHEIAKLQQELASAHEMVALSLLQEQSATQRLRGVSYSGRLKAMEPDVVSALVQAVAQDPSVNVRLAAIDALGKVAAHSQVQQSLTRSLPREDSPMVQAALIDYLVDAHDQDAVGMLRQLAARPDLNPAVLERTRFALQQLSK